ncbi:acetate--CoA ligase family protein [Xenophilus azovorans]|uniref:acetate--CoA ligase family protein n=1 Tax=Xenophilus azovorans TaxID=151755 RepID=UPI000691A2DA|nr:acetate--CoA ligase family protein [Xenophilus azovorans]
MGHSDSTQASPGREPAGRGSLARLLAPRSVAFVGASDNNNMSQCAYRNLLRHGFAGEVFLVNPKQAEVHGQKAWPDLASIGKPVDAVFSLLGAARVPALARECAALGIFNLVVLAGGFSEEGEHGALLQNELVEVAAREGLRVLGPNTIGYLNLHARALLYGSPLEPPAYPDRPVAAGPVSAVVQSGIIAHTLIRGMLSRRVGLGTVVAVGNEADVRIHDVIEHLVDDPHTQVIAAFIETVRDHVAFRRACLRAAAAKKPIVALRAGRSAIGAVTAISHTGALAGDQQVNEAAFRQLGVIAVASVEELVVTAAYLGNHGAPTGKRAAFLAISGGFCEMFADRAEEVGIELLAFSANVQAELRAILPPSAAVSNPLDTTGIAQTDITIFPRVMETLSRAGDIDVLFVGRNPWRATPADPAPVVARYRPWGDAVARSPVPILLVADSLCDISDFEVQFSRDAGLPPEIGGLQFGLQAFVRAAEWRSRVDRLAQQPPAALPPLALPGFATGRAMAEHEVLALLQQADVPTVPWTLARTGDEAVAAAERFGYPVVLKVSSAQIAHKSAMGGVVLDIADASGVRDAWAAVMAAAARQPQAVVDGALLMPMRGAGLELIVGVKSDPTWGQALVVGLGGVWTELLRDTVVCPLPAADQDIADMLERLKGARLLDGGHGLPAVHRPALIAVIRQVARLAAALGDELEALELNPVRVRGSVVEALDGLIAWQRH